MTSRYYCSEKIEAGKRPRFYSILEQKQCIYATLLTLCAVPPFDENLAEDNKVNKLEDSYLLWNQSVHASHSWSHLYEQTRLHVLLVNRAPDDNLPPVIVAIFGPPGVSKTTLPKSIVRRYAKHEAKGPITIVSGKIKRLTFVRCNNDRNCMHCVLTGVGNSYYNSPP